jgi:hypothetical protein
METEDDVDQHWLCVVLQLVEDVKITRAGVVVGDEGVALH